MLIETDYKKGDIVSFKLISGEEVISRLDEETDNTYKLHKPMMLVQGPEGVGLAPFMFSVSADAKFNLLKHSVSCITKTEDNIGKQYTTQTTGIMV